MLKKELNMNYVVFGASSGLGKSISEQLPSKGDTVWMLNRSRPDALDLDDGVNREWISINLESPQFVDEVKNRLKDVAIDALIFCSGIWDSDSDPTKVESSEIYRILNVNTSGFIASVVSLHDNLTKAKSAKVIAIGSIVGLDNATGTSLAYVASKFGMRGAVHSMREWLRASKIGVTCISVGSMSEQETPEGRIPHSDVVELIRSTLRLSSSACVKEIALPGAADLRA